MEPDINIKVESLEDLLDKITPDNQQEAIACDEPIGKEIW
jgi:antitoxin component of MazEF toxin-antitoxin module